MSGVEVAKIVELVTSEVEELMVTTEVLVVVAAEELVVASEVLVVSTEVLVVWALEALVDSAGGGMTLKVNVAPHSAREDPMGQQPPSVQ